MIDQGVAYLNLMLIHKTEFLYAYYQKTAKMLEKEDIDWSQSRIIFISPEFTKYQQNAIEFKDLGIQLWEIHKYNNGLLVFNEVKSPSTKERITAIAKNNAVVKKVTEQIRVYTEEDHLGKVSEKIKELYIDLKTSILNFYPDITIKATKKHIGFRRNRQFAGIHIATRQIMIHFNIKIDELQDPKKVSKRMV